MKKPYNHPRQLDTKTYRTAVISFDRNSTHEEVLYKIIKELENMKFASAKEIESEWFNILGVDLAPQS